jgi:pimeloyl-ACP methyl ester carboxylesterase
MNVRPSRELLVDAGVRLDVLIDAPDDPALGSLVLLPSSMRDSLDCDHFAGLLARAGFRVLRPQPRGMARSQGPMQGLDLNVLAHDVCHVIDKLGHGRAIVAGHAYGHFIARVAALNHPAQVRGVALLAAAARVFPPGLADALDVAADANQPEALRLARLHHAFFAPGNDARVWLEGWHAQWREAYRRAAAQPPKDTWWPVSDVPLLDLQAAEDPWRPEATRLELKDAVGDRVTVRVIANASHALLPEQPEAVANAIAEWAGPLAD